MKKSLITLLLIVTANQALSADYWLRGTVNGITSTSAGLLVSLDTGRPTSCPGSSGWMIIAAEDKAMIAVALMMYAQDTAHTQQIYTDGTSVAGFCRITQYDPRG